MKSDKHLAERVNTYVPEGVVYSYSKMSFYGVNFYLKDRMRHIEKERPSKVLEKEVQDVRIEKEMFISQVENTESPLVELGNKLNSTTYTEVISLYSKSNITRHKLFKKIDSFKKSEFKVDDIKEVLDTNYKRLKPLLTDTSVMSKSPPDIEVKRGKITYSPERIVEIQENLQTIQDEFFKLKIIINRA